MRRLTVSIAVALASVAAIAAVLTSSAGAASPIRCDVGPSSFVDVFVDLSDLGWTARTSTTLDCAGLGVITIDIWEHAVVAYREDENEDGDFDDRGEGRLRGRAQIVIDFTSAGISIPFEGVVRGAIDGAVDDSDVDYAIRASSPGGAQIELYHVGNLDLVNGTFDSLDLSGGTVVRKE